mgnify:CR=1 FL=1
MRIVNLNNGELILKDSAIEGFLERKVNPIGTSAKVDVPRRYLGRRAYVIICKK